MLTLEKMIDQRNTLLMAARTCINLTGNVDHSIGHGYNAAKMRGDTLMAIREILKAAIKLAESEE